MATRSYQPLFYYFVWGYSCMTTMGAIPRSIGQISRQGLVTSAALPLAALSLGVGAGTSGASTVEDSIHSNKFASYPLGKDAYTMVGDVPMCRLLNGLWQLSGAHGFEPNKEVSVAAMAKYASEGYTTFDVADIYGPAEDYVGSFRRGNLASSVAVDCQFFTKWVPRPQEITKPLASAAIYRSLKRMNTDTIDLLQFHWWDYSNKYYYDAMHYLMGFKQDGTIKNIGLTNFDTFHMLDLIEEDAPIVSNQVSYSVLDTRPGDKMAQVCLDKNVKLLCYGTLLGGFISHRWLNKPEPAMSSLTNVSLRKYLPWIQYWGGWGLFQEMLTTLNAIGTKHGVSLSAVALKWVLDRPAVGGAIVGARLGLAEHTNDNKNVFSVTLDRDDLDTISSVQSRGKNLMSVFGDCGSEYRARPSA